MCLLCCMYCFCFVACVVVDSVFAMCMVCLCVVACVDLFVSF